MSEAIIQLEAVSKRFFMGPPWRRRAVDALLPTSLAVAPGETVAVIGESGSGKTTLARLCLGLLGPTSGRVLFGGKPFRLGSPEVRGRIAAVLQNPASSLNPRRTIAASIEEPMRILGNLDRARVRRLLEQVGLPDDMGRRSPNNLSGGQQQRVAIARALSTSPQLIVFDEAVSALDVSVQAQILNLIRDLSEKTGFGCLFITHDIAVARYIADRAIVMRAGRVEDKIDKAALYDRAKHPYTLKLQVASGLASGGNEMGS